MLRRVAVVRPDVSEERIASVMSSSKWQLLLSANVPSSLILFILMTEEIRSFETSVLTRAVRRHIPEDGILHSHRCEHLKSSKTYIKRMYEECRLIGYGTE
jgi:hypothetical protein